jgi:hypothetical protein
MDPGIWLSYPDQTAVVSYGLVEGPRADRPGTFRRYLAEAGPINRVGSHTSRSGRFNLAISDNRPDLPLYPQQRTSE